MPFSDEEAFCFPGDKSDRGAAKEMSKHVEFVGLWGDHDTKEVETQNGGWGPDDGRKCSEVHDQYHAPDARVRSIRLLGFYYMAFQLLGFEDERPLVQAFTSSFKKIAPVFALETRYRAGELTVRMPDVSAKEVLVVGSIHEDPRYILRMLFVARALRHAGVRRCVLLAPWIAYGRQDRVPRPGEVPGGLIIGDTLSRLFDQIVTLDAHSSLFVRAFRRKLANVWAAPDRALALKLGEIDIIIAADKGAIHRARACAKSMHLPLVVLEKKRDASGVKIEVSKKDVRRVKDKRLLIIDDISDTGGTLVTAATMLREAGAGHVAALVSHVPDLSVLRDRVGVVLQVETFYDHLKQEIEASAVSALVEGLRR